MSGPTIEQRLQRRYLVMSTDSVFVDTCKRLTPALWEQVVIDDLDQAGDWHEVLLFRFLLLDLDEFERYDPMDVIRQIRMQYQINLPVFCFGGEDDVRDEMRLARADRLFDKDQAPQVLPMFFEQYAWGA
jgi:hypothetical protein